jgi:hypothetical protein
MENMEIDFWAEIQNLRPVTWVYKSDPTEKRHIGYIAEELDAIDAFKYVVYYDSKNEPAGIKYELLSVYAVEALKLAAKKIEELENKILNIEKALSKL